VINGRKGEGFSSTAAVRNMVVAEAEVGQRQTLRILACIFGKLPNMPTIEFRTMQ
jgi:hypothetical protein